jgi:hypothetical protein
MRAHAIRPHTHTHTHTHTLSDRYAARDLTRALTDDDIEELDALDRTGGTDVAVESKWWRS